VLNASRRVAPWIVKTPLVESAQLNAMLSSSSRKRRRLFFKCEMLQHTGAFKVRGAINAIWDVLEHARAAAAAAAAAAATFERDAFHRIVTFSSGNHAAAVSYAAAVLNAARDTTRFARVEVTVYMPRTVSALKKRATQYYGARVVMLETRQEAEAACKEAAHASPHNTHLISPFDDSRVIAGAGTAALCALEQARTQFGIEQMHKVFVPVGGGGLCSGTFLAAQAYASANGTHAPQTYGVEPLAGNDVQQSVASGAIVRLAEQPRTLADGAMTLACSQRTFHFLRQCAGVLAIDEPEIAQWTQRLTHALRLTVEPTAALTVAGVAAQAQADADEHDSDAETTENILCVLSGGNIAIDKRRDIWQDDALAPLFDEAFVP
jgi:threonine dehydratase